MWFFIDVEHIVSCAHVLDTASGKNELVVGQTFIADAHFLDIKGMSFEVIELIPKNDQATFLEFEDMALLKLSSALEEVIPSPTIQIPKRDTENEHPIRIYSQKQKSWREGKNKAPVENGWTEITLEGEVESGDSGSPIWNAKLQAITAMLVARKKGELRCYAIPLWKIA